MLSKELLVVKDGVKSYKVSKYVFIKLGVLYNIIKKFDNNKFYYNIKNKLNISNKLFGSINSDLAKYNTHDIMTYQQVISLTKRIIIRLFNYDNFYYNKRYVNKNKCTIFKYYLLIELFSKRLYTKISFTTHIKLAMYLFNLNYDNDNFNNYLFSLNDSDLIYLLDYHKTL